MSAREELSKRCFVDTNVWLYAFIESELREKYSLAYWDSLIVAGALNANCEVVYTEDMQNGLDIEGYLRIVNPFRRETREVC